MKRLFKNTYIATAVIMLAVLSSCEKHEVKKSIDNEIIIGIGKPINTFKDAIFKVFQIYL